MECELVSLLVSGGLAWFVYVLARHYAGGSPAA